MGGSGTLLKEAALMATNTEPGLLRRRIPLHSLPDFDRAAWDHAVDAAVDAQVEWDGLLLGNDVHRGALNLAKRSVSDDGRTSHSAVLCKNWLRDF